MSLCSSLYGDRISNLTSIFFQMGWFNHQLENIVYRVFEATGLLFLRDKVFWNLTATAVFQDVGQCGISCQLGPITCYRTGHIPLTCVLNMFECTYIYIYMYVYFSVASHITQRFRFWNLDQLYTLEPGHFQQNAEQLRHTKKECYPSKS